MARGFYVPVLKESVAYDRATGYLSVESFVHAAGGVAALAENEGKMRLILGAHDVPPVNCGKLTRWDCDQAKTSANTRNA